MNTTVEEHQIIVNDLWVMLRNNDVIVVQGDLASKYAEVSGISGTSVYLGATEYSLHINPDENFTDITFDNLPSNFEVMDAFVSRYTLTVYLVNKKKFDDDDCELLWERP